MRKRTTMKKELTGGKKTEGLRKRDKPSGVKREGRRMMT